MCLDYIFLCYVYQKSTVKAVNIKFYSNPLDRIRSTDEYDRHIEICVTFNLCFKIPNLCPSVKISVSYNIQCFTNNYKNNAFAYEVLLNFFRIFLINMKISAFLSNSVVGIVKWLSPLGRLFMYSASFIDIKWLLQLLKLMKNTSDLIY